MNAQSLKGQLALLRQLEAEAAVVAEEAMNAALAASPPKPHLDRAAIEAAWEQRRYRSQAEEIENDLAEAEIAEAVSEMERRAESAWLRAAEAPLDLDD